MYTYYSEQVNILTSELWKIICSSPSYSFVKEPLPVFYILQARYCNQDIEITETEVNQYVSNFSFDWGSDRASLLESFPESCKKILIRERELFQNFFESITDGVEGIITHAIYKYIHKELVEFFIKKYSELSNIECLEPKNVMDLMFEDGIIYEDECYGYGPSIYTPYSNISSLFLNLAEDHISFMSNCYCEEPNEDLAFMARVRLCAWGYNNEIVKHADPSIVTTKNGYLENEYNVNFVMASIPPFGLKIKKDGTNIDVVELLINRFIDSKIKSAYLVFPLSFCYASEFKNLRKKIIDNKLLHGVIEISSKYFKNSPIATVFITLKKYGSETIEFGNMDRKTDRGFVDYIKINNETIVSNDYLIVPSVYSNNICAKEGQTITSLNEIVEICIPEDSLESQNVVIVNDNNFIDSPDDLFIKKEYNTISLVEKTKIYSGKCILVKKSLKGISICPIEGLFTIDKDYLVLRIKEGSLSSLEYLSYIMIENYDLASILSYGPKLDENIIKLFLNAPISIYMDDIQQNIYVKKKYNEFVDKKRRELQAEMERCGIRAATSDLNHILAPTYRRIDSILNQCEEDNIDQSVKSIRNNMQYLNRMIQNAGENFEKSNIAMMENKVNDFFQDYINSCRDYSIVTFDVKYETKVHDDTTINIDTDMFKYLLDTILDNAYRHGFEKRVLNGALVRLSLSPVNIDNRTYILLSVANNGKPFSNDFSIDKFIGRGEFCGNTGHTGLGGNHIYNIVKRHEGFLNITRTSAWPVIYEILIPTEISFDDETNMMNYENRAKCI
ncbi:MAG: HAMP domain-containing histidine kinase [Bacteroidales bacterium]|nr:HAMP domain-containing histidine kinase [Bacteroidales bacterium]